MTLTKNTLLALTTLIAAMTTWTTPTWAENAIEYGDYTVHYNAFTTDVLTPQVAKVYGITRSKNTAMMNITVLKKVMGTTGQPVTAKVTASATNLTGQFRNLDVREIKESGAIYYISEFRVSDRETMDLKIDFTPEGSSKPYSFSFRQQFYTK